MTDLLPTKKSNRVKGVVYYIKDGSRVKWDGTQARPVCDLCTTRPTFNIRGAKKARFCAKHKTKDMVNVKDKTCEKCDKIPTFNIRGAKKARFCAEHKAEGMVDVINKTCELCDKSPTFNIPGAKKARLCAKHKTKDMVNVVSKRCELCDKQPAFNIRGAKKARFCAEHKTKDMVNVVSKRCELCSTKPAFNIRGAKKARFCSQHKTEGMVDVIGKTCELCSTKPMFNVIGEKTARFCSQHKTEDMVDVINKTCELCSTRPTFNIRGEKTARFCTEHKAEGMVDVVSKRCELCDKLPVFNIRGAKTVRFCAEHKAEGMVNVRDKTCLHDWCDTLIYNPLYRGFCMRCFVYTYPNEPNARNYKTKECAVADYVRERYPDLRWVQDKRIDGGCSKRRPDMILDLGHQLLIIEIDENGHTTYDCACERKRVNDILEDLGFRSVVFLRFNPDSYRDAGELIKSCWKKDGRGMLKVENEKRWSDRLNALGEQVDYWMKNTTDKLVETVELYYDR